MIARSFWVAAPGRGEIRHEPLPAPGRDQLQVRALYSGISRGTESLVFNGRVPASEYGRMRAPFQEGDFPGPVKYGYASVGVVEHGPPPLQGRRVFSLFPHQTHYNLAAHAAYPLPDEVPSERAVLAANLETAINGLWDARPHVGDHIVVIGGGAVGCLVSWLAGQIPGSVVDLIDTNPHRATIARSIGVRFKAPSDLLSDADVVIHTSGSPSGLALACRVAGFETTIVEMSWYGTTEVPLALGEAFHAKRLQLKSSQVGHVADSQRARWDYRRRMNLAVSMLRHPALDALITGESSFDDLPQTMATLASAPGDTLCHRIKY